MTDNVIEFAKKKKGFEPLLDSKGRTIPNLFRHRGTGIIYVRKSFAKLGVKPIFQTTGETTLVKAQTKAEILVQRHKNRALGIDDSQVFGRARVRPFSDVANEVLQEHTPHQRASTQKNHRHIIPQLIAIFGDKDIASISVKDFNNEIAKLRQSEKRRRTYFDFGKHMNLIMHYAYNQKYVEHDLTFPNPDPKGKKTGRLYTKDEIAGMFKAASPELKLQLILAFENGMRLSEMLKLRWRAVDFEKGTITLSASEVKTGTATGEGRSFIASPSAINSLKSWKALSDGEYVFGSPTAARYRHRHEWARVKREIGLTGKARWHDLRHTFLTIALLEKKLNPLMVSVFAGVSMTVIQRVYLKPRVEHTADVGLAVRINE